MVTMLYVRSPELTHFITGSLYPLTSISSSPAPPHPNPGNHLFTLHFYAFGFLDFIYHWDHTVFIFLCLIYFTSHNTIITYPCCHICQDFHYFCGWIIFHVVYVRLYVCVCIIFLIYLSTKGHLSCFCCD